MGFNSWLELGHSAFADLDQPKPVGPVTTLHVTGASPASCLCGSTDGVQDRPLRSV